MALDQLSDRLYQSFAQIGAALASEHRLRILNILAQGEMKVEEMAARLGRSVPSTSIHLKVLREASLIERRREGQFVHYRIADASVLQLWLALRDTGLNRLPEVRELMQRYANDPDSLSLMHETALLDRVARGEVILLDLRSQREYAAGHLPGARSIPASELAERLDELPPGKTIYAYCRGPFCVSAIKSTQKLREQGFPVHRVREGVLEWKAAGQPLDTAGDEASSH